MPIRLQVLLRGGPRRRFRESKHFGSECANLTEEARPTPQGTASLSSGRNVGSKDPITFWGDERPVHAARRETWNHFSVAGSPSRTSYPTVISTKSILPAQGR